MPTHFVCMSGWLYFSVHNNILKISHPKCISLKTKSTLEFTNSPSSQNMIIIIHHKITSEQELTKPVPKRESQKSQLLVSERRNKSDPFGFSLYLYLISKMCVCMQCTVYYVIYILCIIYMCVYLQSSQSFVINIESLSIYDCDLNTHTHSVPYTHNMQYTQNKATK